jgi:hypothetical protein
MSDDPEATEEPTSAPTTPKTASSGLNAFFKALRGKTSEKPLDSRQAGMEQSLINKIEKLNFRDQMEMFYTTYSKVCSHFNHNQLPCCTW